MRIIVRYAYGADFCPLTLLPQQRSHPFHARKHERESPPRSQSESDARPLRGRKNDAQAHIMLAIRARRATMSPATHTGH